MDDETNDEINARTRTLGVQKSKRNSLAIESGSTMCNSEQTMALKTNFCELKNIIQKEILYVVGMPNVILKHQSSLGHDF